MPELFVIWFLLVFKTQVSPQKLTYFLSSKSQSKTFFLFRRSPLRRLILFCAVESCGIRIAKKCDYSEHA